MADYYQTFGMSNRAVGETMWFEGIRGVGKE